MFYFFPKRSIQNIFLKFSVFSNEWIKFTVVYCQGRLLVGFFSKIKATARPKTCNIVFEHTYCSSLVIVTLISLSILGKIELISRNDKDKNINKDN